MGLRKLFYLPGSAGKALASIDDGSAALNTRAWPLTGVGRLLNAFLTRIRSLVLSARSRSIRTAINVAHCWRRPKIEPLLRVVPTEN